MRTQTQCNGIWQNSADGSIMYADTAHGVLWVRHVTDTTETWNTKHIAASNLRGYLAAMRENGWLMVSANADVVPNADAYNAWRADMFPHGIPRRVTDYEAAVYDRRLVACEEDAADGWTCPSPSCVSHPLTREAAAMVRMTMRGDCDVSADADDDFDVPTPAEDAQAAAEAEPDGYGQYVGMWTRGNERVCVCADGTVWAHFDHPDDAYESWVRQETLYGVGAFVCETFADRGWVHVSCEADDDVPRYVTDRDAAVPGTVCADDAANGWRYDGLSAVIRDYADVPTPRAVESEPVLPAECNAVTQEIPEVPPQTNEDARVLKVSEHVIPTGQKVAGGEMFPDVSYRSVHAFTVAVLDDVGNVVKRKKVAYAFRHKGMVHVVRRDRYERAGRDATVEAEIAAFVAKLRKAA